MSDAAVAIDPRFPGLRPEVVDGYLKAPAHVVAEVLNGELFVMPRPRRQHSRASSRLGWRWECVPEDLFDDEAPAYIDLVPDRGFDAITFELRVFWAR